MKDSKLYLPNREITLNEQTDYFGHIEKGKAIVSFLKANKDELTDINMFALYGKWGSGKSTLMKYIGDELNNDSYKVLFFKAWEYEKDNNLPLSLLHFIINETGTTGEKIVIELLKDAGDVLKSAIKSISIDIPGIKVSGKDLVDSRKDWHEEKEKQEPSIYNKTKDFKIKFKNAEKAILKKESTKKLIVFIDDLDRCEPENVLNLLSSIKLFFTLGEKVIFFFGCDKDAISKAVKHRYNSIITSDEYLEKIFDITFNMPQEFSIKKLIDYYFASGIKTNNNNDPLMYSYEIANFFTEINFTNPRHLKKVLNKFQIIRNFKFQDVLSFSQNKLIPDNILSDTQTDYSRDENALIQTILTLFFIILHEFYPKTFNELSRFDMKISNYQSASYNYHKTQPKTADVKRQAIIEKLHNKNSGLLSFEIREIKLKELITVIQESNKRIPDTGTSFGFNSMLVLFLPSMIDTLDYEMHSPIFVNQFQNNANSNGDDLCIAFCNYLIKKDNWVKNLSSEYKYANFFEMCKTLL